MAESFARQKFKGRGKKDVSGFWKRGREITLLVASSVEVADAALLRCFSLMRPDGYDPWIRRVERNRALHARFGDKFDPWGDD